jgi:hypothetical protein
MAHGLAATTLRPPAARRGASAGWHDQRVRSVEAVDPQGRTWRVRVLWLPRHSLLVRRFGGWRRRRRDKDSWLDPFDGIPGADVDDLVFGVLVVVGLVLVVGLAWWVVLPLLLLVLDALIIALLLVAGVAVRVLLRRPWSVEATPSEGEPLTRSVVGWRAALRERDALAAALRLGRAEGCH